MATDTIPKTIKIANSFFISNLLQCMSGKLQSPKGNNKRSDGYQ